MKISLLFDIADLVLELIDEAMEGDPDLDTTEDQSHLRRQRERLRGYRDQRERLDRAKRARADTQP